MHSFGAPEVLELREHGRPEPGAGEVRVRVDAVVVNNTRDVLTRSGHHPFSRFVTPPHILGGEHAGKVDAVGAGVDPALVGHRVAVAAVVPCAACEWCTEGHDEACERPELIGVHRQGAYAEFALAPVDNLLPIPRELSSVEAAILATTGPVGLAQVEAAGVGDGHVVIVPGVAGALGSMVATLAHRRGARVIGLARNLARADSMSLPVEAILDATASDLHDQLREACGPDGAHAVIDNICVPAIWVACLAVLRRRGRVVISGAMGDAMVAIDARHLYLSTQSILGVRTGNKAMTTAFWNLVNEGFRMRDDLVETSPLSDAAVVHELIESGEKVGHYALVAGDTVS